MIRVISIDLLLFIGRADTVLDTFVSKHPDVPEVDIARFRNIFRLSMTHLFDTGHDLPVFDSCLACFQYSL